MSRLINSLFFKELFEGIPKSFCFFPTAFTQRGVVIIIRHAPQLELLPHQASRILRNKRNELSHTRIKRILIQLAFNFQFLRTILNVYLLMY